MISKRKQTLPLTRKELESHGDVVFHSGSNYDYQFIIKQLANDLEGQFECIGENT